LWAARNFGMGSSREQAAEALKHLGVAGVVARSFAGIFYRNAINLGLPVLTAPDLSEVADGDRAMLDPQGGTLTLTEKGVTVMLEPIPVNLHGLIADGGLVPHLKRRLSEGTT
jgi:3-isopropylmalate/(R)-2-methylmalate dehydratase small subunit